MWKVNGNRMEMVEGDYGVRLGVTVSGATFAAEDCLRFTFKASSDGETILVKNYSDIVDNTVGLEFTEQESALFPVGVYVYALDWYKSGNFMCNLVPEGMFKVVNKV